MVCGRSVKFFKTIPGGENATIERMMNETASRETFRIVGESTVTVNDYTSGRIFDDALSYSFYPIDLHDEHGVKPKPLAHGKVPTIPRGALIPKGSKNIMVAGRCLSSDRLANSAAPGAGLLYGYGASGGGDCYLGRQVGATPLDIPLPEIREELEKHGAIVPKGTKV